MGPRDSRIPGELMARLRAMFTEAGVTQTPIWHPDDPGADSQRAHEWTIVCQSLDTIDERRAGLSETQHHRQIALDAAYGAPPAGADEVRIKMGSWRRRADQRGNVDTWYAAAGRKIPDGYVPVRVIKGGTVQSEVMGPAELRSIRESVGYSIEDLTRYLKVSRSIVQKWEAGASPIPPGIAAAMEALQDTYQDALETAIAAGGNTIRVPRTDEESWEATGRPARWHRQIAAEVRLEHGARIEWEQA